MLSFVAVVSRGCLKVAGQSASSVTFLARWTGKKDSSGCRRYGSLRWKSILRDQSSE